MSTAPKEIKSLDEIYGCDYATPDDFKPGTKQTVKIAGVELKHFEEKILRGKKIPANDKITFHCTTIDGAKCKRKLVLNKTSMRVVRAAFGEDYRAWTGKIIEVQQGMIDGKKAVLIRPATANSDNDLDFPEENVPETNG